MAGQKRRSSSQDKRAFTLVELLVVIAVIAILLGILIPVVAKTLDTSRRTKCAVNLRAVGQSFRSYAEEMGEYPRTTYISENLIHGWYIYLRTNHAVVVTFSGAPGKSPYTGTRSSVYDPTTVGPTTARPHENDVTAALFLLLRTGRMSSSQFVCPGTSDVPDSFAGLSASTRSNFTMKNNLSYSFTIPYPCESWAGDYNYTGTNKPPPTVVASAIMAKYRYEPKMNPAMALAADLNPGVTGATLTSLTLDARGSVQKAGNSRNHGGAGQNVLYVAGDVSWTTTPFAGASSDNIYTRAATTAYDSLTAYPDQRSDVSDPWGFSSTYGGQPPATVDDSILLPTETARTTSTVMPY